MAKLGKPYPGEWHLKPGEDLTGFLKRTEAMLKAVPNVVQFPVADNYARYHVQSMKPLVLQHIDYLDGYAIPAPHLRGLRAKDVQALLDYRAKLDKLFAAQKARPKAPK